MDMHSPVNAVNDNYIRNLETTFCESLHIEDVQKSEHASAGYDNCNMGKGNLCGGVEQQGAKLNMNCLKKCSTLLYPDMVLPPSSSVEDDSSLVESLSDQSPLESNSCLVLPAPSTLVSAMKGSREKQGRPQLKLTVKWAPDVYDPVPTLLSRTVKGKKQHKSRHRSEKKYVKKGQKGYPSKGSSSKDKKHYRKPSSGTSDMWWLDSHHDKMLEASTELDDLNVVIHDSHCGTSFLKQSIAKVHYPVGEAL
ncbi:hypothetical protein TanjilG_02363 [Lupinus angustifolius]|uniref:Uncharacterized protein n=1 Tax=Lupinus angustifolius TaxID=3871 RepID=A0A1J7IGD6_LUPAN|nr:PREDICTED: uncharacterized protein LOC109346047 [Lupinus angustifolius]XP_019440951.1 PREDICTED: uncharacterized protein LOC109346047 [Lupinus angustifolius]OIW13229.1 hypothetical protein TanjilG_02363 [Lupinus angustifolius]